MQFRIFPALFLFLGSYFPLSIILLIQNINDKYWTSSICNFNEILKNSQQCVFPFPNDPCKAFGLLVASALSLFLMFLFLRRVKPNETMAVVELKSIPNDLINYVFPYVVSFMGLNLSEVGKFYGFLVFLTFMFLITYRSGQILMNPILLMFGWRIYEIKGTIRGNVRIVRALSKRQIKPNDLLDVRVAQDMYIVL